jgi:parallel beta-helix repeat protein
MKHRKLAMMATLVAALGTTAAPAAAKTIKVDDDGAQCATTITSIQAAVDAAAPGDKIEVCPGLYQEQVRITDKDGLKLQAQKNRQATIKFPATTTPDHALVHIDSSNDVLVKGFTISGPYTFSPCPGLNDRRMGVFVDNSSDATITQNHISEIRNANPALWGCQNGIAVQVGRQALTSVGTAVVSDNEIDLYEKGGVGVDGPGSDADVEHNEITASADAQAVVASNGIQVGRSATAVIEHNTVSGNDYTGGTTSGTGVLIFDTVGVVAGFNELFGNDVGVDVEKLLGQPTTGNRVEHNNAHDNSQNGFYAGIGTANNLFKDNKASGNGVDCQDDSGANTWKNNRGTTDVPDGLCKP